jgi:hypothetical protein
MTAMRPVFGPDRDTGHGAPDTRVDGARVLRLRNVGRPGGDQKPPERSARRGAGGQAVQPVRARADGGSASTSLKETVAEARASYIAYVAEENLKPLLQALEDLGYRHGPF